MRIKLAYAPEWNTTEKGSYPKQPALLPLISLPVIRSFLSKFGHDVEQDDLDIKTYVDNADRSHPERHVDMRIFDDLKRVKRHICGKTDDELEEGTDRLLKKTRYKGYDMCGLAITNCWTSAPLGASMCLAKRMKEDTGSLITIGGPRFETDFEGIPLREIPFTDVFAFTSNHYEFAKLAGYLDNCNVREDQLDNTIILNKKSGDAFRSGRPSRADCRDISRNPSKETMFPRPDFDGLPLDLYRFIPRDVEESRISGKKMLILPYYFVYKCPNHCIFCKDSISDYFMMKPPEEVAEDLGFLSRKYRTKSFIFTNTSVNPAKLYTERLADSINSRDLDLRWFDCATFNNMDAGLMKKLHESGARRFVYGMECASPRMQEYLEKGIDLGHASRMLKEGDRLGIWNELEIISGLPHETKEDTDQSIDFLRQNKDYIDYYYITRFYLTQSRLSRDPAKYGITNIRQKEDRSTEGTAFDEIGGKKWEEKVKQQDEDYIRYDRLRHEILNPCFEGSNMYFYKLFYLYSVMDSKKDIKEFMRINGESLV